MRKGKRLYNILLALITVFALLYLCFQNNGYLYKYCILNPYLKINNLILKKSKWEKQCEIISIKSTFDSTFQKAYFFKTTSNEAQPLVVSLHTWSGNYLEYDGLSKLSIKNNYNYIHPNFRGANNNPDACLSNKVISDIDDAIDYAKKNANIDESKIFIIGASGGGYTGLGAFIKSKHKIAGLSIWVPITDLVSWYKYGIQKNKSFVTDILDCTSSTQNKLNSFEAKKRSPIYWTIPEQKLKNCRIKLYTGINDGIKGDVPISHTINFYNNILKTQNVVDSLNYVTDFEKQELKKSPKSSNEFNKISNRKIYLKKSYQNISITIFEGGHEMLLHTAFLDLLKKH